MYRCHKTRGDCTCSYNALCCEVSAAYILTQESVQLSLSDLFTRLEESALAQYTIIAQKIIYTQDE